MDFQFVVIVFFIFLPSSIVGPGGDGMRGEIWRGFQEALEETE